MKKIVIETEFIKLNQFLKWAGICDTGGEADIVISQEKVLVNGQIETRRGKKLYSGDQVTVYESEYIVSGE